MTIDYPLASDTWGAEERRAIEDVLDSGKLTYGQKVLEFEASAANFFGSEYAVMVNSGSSANLLALAAIIEANEIPRDFSKEVIVPAVSWATTYFPISQLGLRIRLVDVDLLTLNATTSQIREAINENTVGIFAVNLLGNPSELDLLRMLADERGLFLLEDNCESMGASIEGRQAGTFGDIGTFSTYFSHHISTIEGGFCLTDDIKLYQFMISMRSHGWTRGLPIDNLVFRGSDPFTDSFMFALPGFNLRPMELQAAIGLEQLKKLDSFVDERRDNAKVFLERARRLQGKLTVQSEHGASSWFGFSFLLDRTSEKTRKEVVDALIINGIAVRPIVAGNIARHPVAARLNMILPEAGLPNSDWIHDNGFFVGNHHYSLTKPIGQLFDLLDSLV